jgi:hypothetical protein
VPGITELTPTTGIDVLIISDDEPILQALRTELGCAGPGSDSGSGSGSGGID